MIKTLFLIGALISAANAEASSDVVSVGSPLGPRADLGILVPPSPKTLSSERGTPPRIAHRYKTVLEMNSFVDDAISRWNTASDEERTRLKKELSDIASFYPGERGYIVDGSHKEDGYIIQKARAFLEQHGLITPLSETGGEDW